MNNSVPVNPIMLQWARKTAGYDIEDVVIKLKRKRITEETISNWEKGKDSPSYPQLERLAYEIYKRPLAIFFFPAPPEEETPKQSFRTLPEQQIESLPPRLKLLVREAKVMQMNLAELFDNKNPASRNILKDLSFKPKDSIKNIAQTVREYLNIDLKTQVEWKSSEDALNNWRNVFEDCGIFVFKNAFKLDMFSGFCLYDDNFPIIYINNSNTKNRQTFTLFHELAHLLFHTGGVDMRSDQYVNQLESDSRRIEILCNGFTGELLVPESDFVKRTTDLVIDDRSISSFASRYHVSREVILRKLLDRKLISNSEYRKKAELYAKQISKKKGKGGDYYLTKRIYLGEKYINQVFSSFYQNKISIDQAADYLNINVSKIGGIESLIFKGTSAA